MRKATKRSGEGGDCGGGGGNVGCGGSGGDGGSGGGDGGVQWQHELKWFGTSVVQLMEGYVEW